VTGIETFSLCLCFDVTVTRILRKGVSQTLAGCGLPRRLHAVEQIEIYFYTIIRKGKILVAENISYAYYGLGGKRRTLCKRLLKECTIKKILLPVLFCELGTYRCYMLSVTDRLIPARLGSTSLDSIQTNCLLQCCFVRFTLNQLIKKFPACVEPGNLSSY
jgi:hypothetical protein